MRDLFTGASGRTDDAETLAALEVDYTPPAVAVQLLLALRRERVPGLALGDFLPGQSAAMRGRWPLTALDPSAGSGCWGRALAAVFADTCPYLWGVEPRESERENISAAYDAVYFSDLEDFVSTLGARPVDDPMNGWPPRFDLVATNPPFSAFARNWPAFLRDAGWLQDHAIVALYGLSQWGQSEDAIEAMRRWCPTLQIRVGGRIAHRGDGKADAREYSLWVWSMANRSAGLTWRTVQLPALPAALRRWSPSAVPGTYPLDAAFVDEIGAKYL